MSKPERELFPDRSPQERFGYTLRRWRKERGLSQAELGDLVHVSAALVQRTETGERRLPREVAVSCDKVLRAGGALIRAWDELDRAERAERVRADVSALVGSGSSALALGEQDAYRETDEPGAGGSGASDVAEEVRATVRENQEHAGQSERREIGDMTLEQFWTDVARLSRDSMTAEPLSLLAQLRTAQAGSCTRAWRGCCGRRMPLSCTCCWGACAGAPPWRRWISGSRRRRKTCCGRGRRTRR
jgi:transcriptional regulator with XRE-family HTH domain